MIDADKLIATLLEHDDDLDIDMLDLHRLIGMHLAETINDDARIAHLISYDICPIHECDIEICADDDDTECRQYQSGFNIK